MKMCSVPNCNRKHYAKGLCKNHYHKIFYEKNKEKIKEYYRNLNKKRTKKWKDERNLKKRVKYWTDEKFREKRKEQQRECSKRYVRKKYKENPNWNKERQREYRRKHPEMFNFIMCRSYFRKLTPKQKKELIKGDVNG